MDPLWASVAELWWIAPAAVGAGTLGFVGVRMARRDTARRLAYDAARVELAKARSAVTSSRSAVRIARAEVARVQAERAASRASARDVSTARRELQTAQRDARAASATVRARRAQLTAARAALGDRAAPPPLDALRTRHDAITARWMEYETDPARLIAFPAMSDAKVPTTSVFLEVRARASHARPKPDARVSPDEYAAYRDAVVDLERTFEAAEKEAWRQARASGAVPAEQPAWTVAAQDVLARSTDALARAAEAAAELIESRRTARDERARTEPGRADPTQTTRPPSAPPQDAPPPSGAPASDVPPPPTARPIWPVPSRTDRRPRD
ncbi:hypothetical protein [Microbacterium sp. bgisy189]|uniref:hypothetical protein n=1 Tax=Microbacterium sp. bgisy189 TaxID=3413798 RepID=UPI003EBFAFDB